MKRTKFFFFFFCGLFSFPTHDVVTWPRFWRVNDERPPVLSLLLPKLGFLQQPNLTSPSALLFLSSLSRLMSPTRTKSGGRSSGSAPFQKQSAMSPAGNPARMPSSSPSTAASQFFRTSLLPPVFFFFKALTSGFFFFFFWVTASFSFQKNSAPNLLPPQKVASCLRTNPGGVSTPVTLNRLKGPIPCFPRPQAALGSWTLPSTLLPTSCRQFLVPRSCAKPTIAPHRLRYPP